MRRRHRATTVRRPRHRVPIGRRRSGMERGRADSSATSPVLPASAQSSRRPDAHRRAATVRRPGGPTARRRWTTGRGSRVPPVADTPDGAQTHRAARVGLDLLAEPPDVDGHGALSPNVEAPDVLEQLLARNAWRGVRGRKSSRSNSRAVSDTRSPARTTSCAPASIDERRRSITVGAGSAVAAAAPGAARPSPAAAARAGRTAW